jgi:ABC-2 type transport system ATP-binding protein
MITIDGLTKHYGAFCAVDNISLEIPRGEILGLLGPNGAGKSTTLRILTCYMQPTSGTVRVKDFDVRSDAIDVKRLIGYLPESAPIYPDMLVYEYLQYVAAIRGLAADRMAARIRELADLCGLSEVMHKAVSQLSKGYKQRVGLAHAMMADPEILVLDEPTSGLDPNQIVEIRDIIRAIGREKTVILSTHILSEAEATCDRVVIIHKGHIVADDRTEALKRDAGNTYTLHLELAEGVDDDLRRGLSAVEGVEEAVVAAGNGGDGGGALDLQCRGDRDIRADVYAIIKASDRTLLAFSRQTRTLETIFRELTREG